MKEKQAPNAYKGFTPEQEKKIQKDTEITVDMMTGALDEQKREERQETTKPTISKKINLPYDKFFDLKKPK